MTKEEDIANIVKHLDSLSLHQRKHILEYIEHSKSNNDDDTDTERRGEAAIAKQREEGDINKFRDRDGAILCKGDRVILLTKGVDNDKGEEATIYHLPISTHKTIYIDLVPKRFYNIGFTRIIKKIPKNVRKIKSTK